MVHLDYSLDNGKLLGLLLAEMTLFGPCTYGTPSLGRAGANCPVPYDLAQALRAVDALIVQQ